MSDNIALSLQERTIQGKAVKQLRRDGMVPAVIHDHGKPSKVVMAPALELSKVYQEAGKHHPLALTLGEQKYMALIKDIRFDPKKHNMQHVVFNAIKQDEKVETEVPIILEGEVPAEKAGLIVINTLDHIDIEALPKDLIDSITVSAESLVEIGDKITVADLKVPEGVTILTELEHTLAVVEEPRAHVEEEAEAAEGEEGEESAEGEEGEAAEGDEGEAAEKKTEDSEKKDGVLFRQEYLERSEVFYEKHGGKTVLFARFVPIVRTFAALVAGVGKMPRKRFVIFDVFGAIIWGTGITLLGYWLGRKIPNIDKYLLPVILLAIVVSFGPSLYHIIKSVRAKKQ